MKKRTLAAIPCYAISLLVLLLYAFAELYPRVRLNPAGRVLMLVLCCGFTYLGSRLLSRAYPDKVYRIMKCTFAGYFVLYLGLLLNFTLFDPMFSRMGISQTIFSDPYYLNYYLQNELNLLPFTTISDCIQSYLNHTQSLSVVVLNLAGNFVAFMPMALFLPLLVKACKKLLPFALVTAGAVIVVELLQFIFAVGICDIDDLILNVMGAIAAYAVLHIKFAKAFLQKLMLIPYE